jgi:hypothetical protein
VEDIQFFKAAAITLYPVAGFHVFTICTRICLSTISSYTCDR